MKKKLLLLVVIVLAVITVRAQDLKSKDVPSVVKSALAKKYPEAVKVSWEKEKGNYEANWGGKSGEDNSVVFTPSGSFVEIVKAISVTDLPKNVAPYVKRHYKGAKIREAGKVTDAAGKTIKQQDVFSSSIQIDISNVPTGTYILKLFTNKGIQNFKILKQ